MISIARASSAEDFEIAAEFLRLFGEWDLTEGLAYGIPPEVVQELYHSDSGSEHLSVEFNRPGAMLLMARWDGLPAGCFGFEPFEEDATELRKFYVDPQFRGKGIGRALMEAVMAEIAAGDRRRAVLATTVYMKSALSLYEAFDFRRCEPFRPIPDAIRHTEVFMWRPI